MTFSKGKNGGEVNPANKPSVIQAANVTQIRKKPEVWRKLAIWRQGRS
jgi:hypothetical protein